MIIYDLLCSSFVNKVDVYHRFTQLSKIMGEPSFSLLKVRIQRVPV
jgi:hypothetical protein